MASNQSEAMEEGEKSGATFTPPSGQTSEADLKEKLVACYIAKERLKQTLGGMDRSPPSEDDLRQQAVAHVDHTSALLKMWCQAYCFNGGLNSFGVWEGGFPPAEVLAGTKLEHVYAKKSIGGTLGVDIITRGDYLELRQVRQQGGVTRWNHNSKYTSGEDVKSITFPIQTIINLPISQEFNAFLTKVWDLNYQSDDQYLMFNLREDETCTIEFCCKAQNQSLNLTKLYHKDGNPDHVHKAFGTSIRLSPFSWYTLLWHMPMIRLRQVLGSPSERQKQYVKTLIQWSLEIRDLYETEERLEIPNPGFRKLVLKLGQSVRKGDSVRILDILARGRLEPLIYEDDPKVLSCLKEITCLMPRFIFVIKVGLERSEPLQTRLTNPGASPVMQRGRILGAKCLFYAQLFDLSMRAQPMNESEEAWFYECLYHAPTHCSLPSDHWLITYKVWREANLTQEPQEFWAEQLDQAKAGPSQALLVETEELAVLAPSDEVGS